MKKTKIKTSEQIKAARVASGLNQTEIAKKIGITRRTLITYEQHPGKMKVSHYLKLCKILNLEPFYIT